MSGKRPHPETAVREWVSPDEFDIHENGQLRLTAAGEQTHLLPLPDPPRTEEP